MFHNRRRFMRKFLVGLVASVAFVATPATSHAMSFVNPPRAVTAQVCQCAKAFADHVVTSPSYDRQLSRAMRRAGITRSHRRKTMRGIYDWQAGGYQFRSGWCASNRKACAAAYACIGAASVTLANDPAPYTDAAKYRHAAVACAVTAAATWRAP